MPSLWHRQQDDAGTGSNEINALHAEPMTGSILRSRLRTGDYASSRQVSFPHLHLMILTDLPLRESRSVWTSVGVAPHRLHTAIEAVFTSTAVSRSKLSLTLASSKRSDNS